MPGLRPFLASALLFSSFAACEGDVLVGEFEPEAGANGGAGGTTATVSTSTSGGGSAGAPGCTKRVCQRGAPLDCGNCEDDDNDGYVDSEDPDCLSPCQDSENSYGDIPGQSGANCARDCYFDQDSGSGNDGCHWDHQCDPQVPNLACPYDPETLVGTPASMSCDEAQGPPSEDCRDTCLPLVPNGCDCFGCCQIPGASAPFVYLGSQVNGTETCTRGTLGDPEMCRPCTPVDTCFNDCGECEVCVGKPEPPISCGGDDDTPQTCPADTEGCGLTGQSDCSVDEYCITGCCILTIK